MSHIPVAFLFLGSLAPLYGLAAMLDRKETNERVRRSRQVIARAGNMMRKVRLASFPGLLRFMDKLKLLPKGRQLP